jgi:hypothetical protein
MSTSEERWSKAIRIAELIFLAREITGSDYWDGIESTDSDVVESFIESLIAAFERGDSVFNNRSSVLKALLAAYNGRAVLRDITTNEPIGEATMADAVNGRRTPYPGHICVNGRKCFVTISQQQEKK